VGRGRDTAAQTTAPSKVTISMVITPAAKTEDDCPFTGWTPWSKPTAIPIPEAFLDDDSFIGRPAPPTSFSRSGESGGQKGGFHHAERRT